MRRRAWITSFPLALFPLALAGCSSALTRPYVQRQNWDLTVAFPPARPPRRGGKVLLVRTVEAAPVLGDQGLKTLDPDGAMRTDFYNLWAVPPAEGVGSALRQYLAQSGLFAAVLAPGSLAESNLTLEAELMQLWVEPAQAHAVASVSIVLLATGSVSSHVLLQATETATSPLASGADPAAQVAAQRAALAEVFRKTVSALAHFA